MMRINIPDAPLALKSLLERLPAETGGFIVSQHYTDPRPDEWYAGWGAGDVGPYQSAEAAVCGGIMWLHELYTEARAEADEREVQS